MKSASASEQTAAKLYNVSGGAPVLLVCEHASNHVPAEFTQLGLDDEQLRTHIAYDIGALGLAKHLSALLDAPLVYSTLCRLLYDCNRPLQAHDAIPTSSEDTFIPGNQGLTAAQKAARAQLCYQPFEALLTQTLAAMPVSPVLLSIHSFTPVYKGQHREIDIGIICDEGECFARSLLQHAAQHTPLNVAINEPYGPQDGVAHTLNVHGNAHGYLNAMLEIKNDLISTPEQQQSMAQTLAPWINQSLALLQDAHQQEVRNA